MTPAPDYNPNDPLHDLTGKESLGILAFLFLLGILQLLALPVRAAYAVMRRFSR